MAVKEPGWFELRYCKINWFTKQKLVAFFIKIKTDGGCIVEPFDVLYYIPNQNLWCTIN